MSRIKSPAPRSERPSAARPDLSTLLRRGTAIRCQFRLAAHRVLRAGLGFILVVGAASRLAAETAALPATSIPPGAASPKIQFSEPVHDFGKVQAGTAVQHTFRFTNPGDAVLVLANVQPSCGCTTVGEWSRQVEPGQTGTIAVQFNSSNFSGPVAKSVTVTCNDKAQPAVTLQLKGTIWKPIDVTPPFAVLNVPVGMQGKATAIVRIVNNLEEAITLQAPESSNPAFAAQLTETNPGREFQLTLSTGLPVGPGQSQAQITLKTSSTNMPVITVAAWANVQPTRAGGSPVSTRPPQALQLPVNTANRFSNPPNQPVSDQRSASVSPPAPAVAARIP